MPSFVPSFLGATFVVSALLEPRTEIRSPKSHYNLQETWVEGTCLGMTICCVQGIRFPKEELSVGWQSVAS